MKGKPVFFYVVVFFIGLIVGLLLIGPLIPW